ncbi:MAG: signal recognition particle-docking protein FtsY, partial [Bartonella sp.]|nr:signal recognition particle-docking protein FtsY [Bartonella sp.]
MTKFFIKKILSFNTSKEKIIKKEQPLISHKISEEEQNEYESEKIKSKYSSIDVQKKKCEQKKIQKTTLIESSEKIALPEKSSRKVIVTDTLVE